VRFRNLRQDEQALEEAEKDEQAISRR